MTIVTTTAICLSAIFAFLFADDKEFALREAEELLDKLNELKTKFEEI